jgi:hypothetical protein
MMAARLKVMNAYLPSFPSPENTSFQTGEMIDIILSMVPKEWIEKMITAKIEPRSMTIKELVDHLENLELQDEAGTAAIPKKKKDFKSSARKTNHGSNSTNEKGCALCKLFKGANSPAWKTHTTEQCKSKGYYSNKLEKADFKDYKSGNKRANKGHYNDKRANKRNKQQNFKAMKAEIKKSVRAAIKKRESGVSSSEDSE